MKHLKKDFLSEVRTNMNIGFPLTPSTWANDPKYYDVLMICLANNTRPMLVMGNKGDLLTLKREALEGSPVILRTIDNEDFYLNLAHVVKIIPLQIVERDLYSRNPNFEQGRYRCRWLIPEGEKVKFFDEFRG